MEHFLNIVCSVTAGLIIHLISKWIDRNKPDN